MEVINKYYKLFKLCLIIIALVLYTVINLNTYFLTEVYLVRVNVVTGKIYSFDFRTRENWVEVQKAGKQPLKKK